MEQNIGIWFKHLSFNKEMQNNISYINGIINPSIENVNSGSISENVSFIKIRDKVKIAIELDNAENYVLQIREVIKNDGRGTKYKYNVYVNDVLVSFRDYTDHGGGPYISTFIEFDKGIVKSGINELAIEMIEGSLLISDLYIYNDLHLHSEKVMETQMDIGFLLAAYFESGDETILERARKVLETFEFKTPFARRMMVLVPFIFNHKDPKRVNTREEYKNLFIKLYTMLKEFNIPLELRFISDWAGTPKYLLDDDGIPFSDIKYQQITYAPDYYEKDDSVIALFENNENPKIREFFAKGDKEKAVHFGGGISKWGMSPWLSFNVKAFRKILSEQYKLLLDAYCEFSEEIRAKDGKYPFTPDCGTGHEILYFPTGIDSLNRDPLWADFNPETIRDSGYTLDPRKGLTEENKKWMHNNLADYNKFLVESIYNGLEKDRILICNGEAKFPEKMVKHRVRGEAYAYPNTPMCSEYYPISEVGMAELAVPGSQWFHSDVFKWLLKHRELGVLANPNEECMGFGNPREGGFIVTPKAFSSEVAAQFKIGYAMGSEYHMLYNWWRYPEIEDAIAKYMDNIICYTSYETEGFTDKVEIEVLEENKFSNKLEMEIENYQQYKNGLTIKIISPEGSTIAYRYISGEFVYDNCGILDIRFNELFCMYPDVKYLMCLSSIDIDTVKCKNVKIRADLTIERLRSHMIGYRRYYEVLKKRIEKEIKKEDIFAKEAIKAAEKSAKNGEFINAVKRMYKADVLITPIRYTLACKANESFKLEPFKFYLQTDIDTVLFLDVESYEEGNMKLLINSNDDCKLNLYDEGDKEFGKLIKSLEISKGQTAVKIVDIAGFYR